MLHLGTDHPTVGKEVGHHVALHLEGGELLECRLDVFEVAEVVGLADLHLVLPELGVELLAVGVGAGTEEDDSFFGLGTDDPVVESAELETEGELFLGDWGNEESLAVPDPPEELGEGEVVVADLTTGVRGSLGGDVPLVAVEPHVEEGTVLLLEDDGVSDIRDRSALLNALTPVEEPVEGAADVVPVEVLVEDVTASRADDGVELRGVDLVVDEEDQVREPGVALALDAEFLLEVLKGPAGAKGGLEGRYVEV